MMIDEKIPRAFLDYQKKLKMSLSAKGISQRFVYKGIGMSQTTWERRLKNLDFTGQEIMAICDLLNRGKSAKK